MRWYAVAFLVPVMFIAATVTAFAHVGSPDIFYEGDAGPYHLLVTIQPPDVVPGIALVSVRVERGEANTIEIRPVYYSTGKDGAPKADVAERSTADPHIFSGKLWLMERGSSSVNIDIDGPSGKGSVLVPTPAIATARRVMPPGLGIVLACLGVFLFVGAISLLGASVREAGLPPNVEVNAGRKRRARIVMAATALLFAAAAYGGDRWWGVSDNRYLRHMFKPTTATTAVTTSGDERILTLRFDSPVAIPSGVDNNIRLLLSGAQDLIPDHGKLMHLFLIQEAAPPAFAHLHPELFDTGSFQAVLPRALPPGHYRVFADIVRSNGLAETITSSLDVDASARAASAPAQRPAGSTEMPPSAATNTPAVDPDDSWRVGSVPQQSASQLDDGSLMTWQHQGDFTAGQLASLDFKVTDPGGAPAALEPYMGMMSHAAIMRDDGLVFMHLHPMGTVSMASEEAFASREAQMAQSGPAVPMGPGHQMNGGGMANGGMPDMPGMTVTAPPSQAVGEISFPYAFPKSGHYFLWVQVKRQGRILTGVFETTVK